MTSFLGFVLACAAIAGMVGTAVSLVTRATAAPLVRGRFAFSAAARADLALLAGIAPALAALATVAATAAPSIGALLGLAQDHCSGHGHHFHICFVHASVLPPALATVGAFALAIWAYRAGALLNGFIQARAQSRTLEGLGRRRSGAFPIFVLPGSRLCHAIGLWRQRIMLSADIEAGLAADELASALAHEASHLRRRDPLAGFVLSVAGLFVPPSIAARFRSWHRKAAEEACDTAAAAQVRDGILVASALVKVAGLQRGHDLGPCIAGPAFGDHALESRVRALLEKDDFIERPARWHVAAVAGVISFAILGIAGVETLHHTAEHLLGHLFHRS